MFIHCPHQISRKDKWENVRREVNRLIFQGWKVISTDPNPEVGTVVVKGDIQRTVRAIAYGVTVD